ncbi:SDR family oxidoreductase [bacterium]|nr:SDR family oxidoreductase [bacterium]
MGDRLKDKVVVLSGAATGIGRCFANALADEGAKLAITYRKTSCDKTIKDLKDKGTEFIDVKVDIAKEDDTKNLAAKTMEKFGKIDVLINNAAIFGDLSLTPFLNLDPEMWKRVINTNINGNFFMCRAILPEMAKQKKGVILNIGSTIWLFPKLPLIPYITGKAAMIGFTRCLAADPTCVENNIRVNCLMPGGTWDEATIGLLGNVPGAEQQVIDGQNIKRREMPEDLVEPMIFMITDSSRCMSGNAVAADMGLTCW